MKKRRIHKILSLILAFALVSGLLPAAAQADVNDFDLGGGVAGTLEGGTLTVSKTAPDGTGIMTDFSGAQSPVYTTTDIVNVVIESGVLHIGDNAFYKADGSQYKITGAVTVGDSVETIGKKSFADSLITSAGIGNNVDTVGDQAFYNNALASLTIGNRVRSIHEAAFAINKLTAVTIPDSVEALGEGAFAYNELTAVSVGSGVSVISKDAFMDNRLEAVTIPATVRTVSQGAFYKNALTRITIGSGVAVAEDTMDFDPGFNPVQVGTTGDHLGFKAVYDTGGKQAGTYRWDAAAGRWDKMPPPAADEAVLEKIAQGFIPVAGKAELGQIGIAAENTFGTGTAYENTYTGGLDKKYIQVADIDLAGDNFVPVGYDLGADTAAPFTGAFDGNGFEISNLTIDRDKELQGLFSVLGNGALITDVAINGASLTASSRTGALAGEAVGASIEACTVTNVRFDFDESSSADGNIRSFIGGFVGKAADTAFRGLELNGFQMTAESLTDTPDFDRERRNIGGVAGLLNGGEITDTQVKNMRIDAVKSPVDEYSPPVLFSIFKCGGLAGELQNSGAQPLVVDGCSASGLSLIVNPFIVETGGLIGVAGVAQTTGDITIRNSNSAGVIQGKTEGMLGATAIGGFISCVTGAATPRGYILIKNCNASVDINGLGIDTGYVDSAASHGFGGFGARLINVRAINCHASGTLDSANIAGAGGFAGHIYDSSLETCSASGDVLGYINNGGFAGIIIRSSLKRCCATGDVQPNSGNGAGPIVFGCGGFASNISADISDCYYSGDIGGAGSFVIGGFALMLNGRITNVYASGSVTGDSDIFTFARNINPAASIISSYWNQTANPSGVAVPDGTGDIRGAAAAELMQKATFTGWDISDSADSARTTWKIEEARSFPYFFEPSGDAALSGLELSSGTLSPAFAGDIREYAASVDSSVSSLTLTPTVNEAHATVTVNGTPVASGSASDAIGLSVGDNTITVEVTAQDGSKAAYTITVRRAAPSRRGSLAFGSAAYTVSEDGGSVTITVCRTGGSDGSVSADYAAGGGTATAGSDYVPVGGTLTFADGETEKAFDIIITDDAVYEGNETVGLTLGNAGGGAVLGEQGTAVLTVEDNEAAQPSAPVIRSAAAGNGQVTVSWDEVPDSLAYNVYSSTASGIYATTPAAIVDGGIYSCAITGLANGTPYFFVVTAVNQGGESAYSNEAGAMPITVPGAPADVTAAAGNGEAVVSFAAPADNGGSPITGYTVTSSPGNIITTGAAASITVTGLTNWTAYTFTVQAVNAAGTGPASAASNAATPHAPSDGNHGEKPPAETANRGETGVKILINGKSETAATATTTLEGGKTVTRVVLDDKKVEEKLRKEGSKAVITIPVESGAAVVIGVLNGQTVKNMENKEAVLEIRTGPVTYTLPASQIDIDAVSEQLGKQVELKDITVNIKISEPAAEIVKIMEETSEKNGCQLVVRPVEFEITCSSGSKSVEISKFNAYVERLIAIPEGIDPSKITTGIVLNPDGTFSHVPTEITVIDGRYYAKINSLTNSSYSVIWNPITFKDVEGHWAREAVNDMGSRLVVSGIGGDSFGPGRDITRAEFAAIAVRALGLMRPGMGKDAFNDVTKASWYYDAVSIAHENGIISGYGNARFGPEDRITREQAMAIIARTMDITGLKIQLEAGEAGKLLESFADSAGAADYAKGGIAACIKAGIVTGRGGDLIVPKDNITRAEAAAMVQRLLKKSGLIN